MSELKTAHELPLGPACCDYIPSLLADRQRSRASRHHRRAYRLQRWLCLDRFFLTVLAGDISLRTAQIYSNDERGAVDLPWRVNISRPFLHGLNSRGV